MKTNFFTLYILPVVLSVIPFFSYAQGINNTGGTSLVANGSVNIVIENGGFKNEGTFIKGTSTFVFAGSNATSSSVISGTASTDFYNLTLNKSPNGIQLNRNIDVSGTVTFQSGDSIFLNNYNVNLGSTGSISGEDNSRRFTGPTGGYIMITQALNAPSSVNPGNIGISITSAANMGSTVIKRFHTIWANQSIRRSFEILPANNSGLDASISFYYFQAELNGISEPAFQLYSSSDNGVTWSLMNNTGLYPIPDYITSSSINSFGLQSAFPTGFILPVQLLYLKGSAVNGNILLNWATSSEIDNDRFEVERSSNGISFAKTGTVKGKGNSDVQQTYQFMDDHTLAGTNYYRLKQVDYNQNFIYSKVISVVVQEKQQAHISLAPNPASNSLHLYIPANKPEQVQLDIIDMNGKIHKSISLWCNKGENNFNIQIDVLPKGLYYIRFAEKSKRSIGFLKM